MCPACHTQGCWDASCEPERHTVVCSLARIAKTQPQGLRHARVHLNSCLHERNCDLWSCGAVANATGAGRPCFRQVLEASCCPPGNRALTCHTEAAARGRYGYTLGRAGGICCRHQEAGLCVGCGRVGVTDRAVPWAHKGAIRGTTTDIGHRGSLPGQCAGAG